MLEHVKTAIVVAALIGCGGKTGTSAIDKTAEFRDRMCECKSKECADGVNREMADWGKSLGPQPELPEAELRRLNEISAELEKCFGRALGLAQADASTTAAAATGTAVAAPTPTPDAAPTPPPEPPKPAVFDPAAPLFGLALEEVNGWEPRNPRAGEPFVSFKHPGQIVGIRVLLIDSSPKNAAALRKDDTLVGNLNLAKIKKVSGENKTPQGWNAIVTGKGDQVELDMKVYVEIVRHGPHTLMCSANLTSLMGEPISEEDARAVCASVYPKSQ